MEQVDYNRKKQHLTKEERANIEMLYKEKVKPSEIAERLGRCKSVISREINRNAIKGEKGEIKYVAKEADKKYKERRRQTGAKIKLASTMDLIEYVEKKILKKNWSPDAAIGRAKLEHPEWKTISTKTYYNYVDKGLVNVRTIHLALKKCNRPKKRRVVKGKKQIGRSIDERPKEANNREEFGHWEMDTIIGKREKSEVLLTLTERVTGLEIIYKMQGRTAKDTEAKLKKIKSKYGKNFHRLFKSITADNGSEFSSSKNLETILKIPIYHAHPYCSYERGTNENYNGIIRRFIPKGTPLESIPDSLIRRIEAFMNGLPRKRFGYQTPLEHMVQLLNFA